MTMNWTEDLSVGVAEIDGQHKELIARSNGLFDAIAQGRGKDELARLLAFLQVYIVTHFELEELYMRQYAYPDQDSHRGEHRTFVRTVNDMRAALEKAGPTDALVAYARTEIVEWLLRHIAETDKAFGGFLKAAHPRRVGERVFLDRLSPVKRHIAGPADRDAGLLNVLDGVLEEGLHEVALAPNQQTAWLTVPAGMSCLIRLTSGTGGLTVLMQDENVIRSASGEEIELSATTFRMIAENAQKFSISITRAVR